jgi:sigma-B regulation protein RsbQ
LPKLAVPALILQCREDVIAPIAVGEYVQDHLPHGQLVVLDATGHCPHLSAPEETIAAMKDFLGS